MLSVMFAALTCGCNPIAPPEGANEAEGYATTGVSASMKQYVSVRGNLTGKGIITLNGRDASFESLAGGEMAGLAAEYYGKAPDGERAAVAGGDFAGVYGLLEYPGKGNNGRLRIYVSAAEKKEPLALSILLGNEKPGAKDLQRQKKLAAHYYQIALQLDASHSEGFDHAIISQRIEELLR